MIDLTLTIARLQNAPVSAFGTRNSKKCARWRFLKLRIIRMLSGAGLRNRSPASEPEGFTEISRWLRSAATTPPVTPQVRTHSEGVPERRFQAAPTQRKPLRPLQGRTHLGTLSGGVVAPLLNHRLFSVIPPGYQKQKERNFKTGASGLYSRHCVPPDCDFSTEHLLPEKVAKHAGGP